MAEKVYSQRLGSISDAQFQAALDRFNLGHFTHAESIPFGNFGQNVFVSSTSGDYVLRGQPHFWWQFPTEQFFINQLHEKTSVPIPWPYLVDTTSDIFGWSFVLMPRMTGLQLVDPQVKKSLDPADQIGIARALGTNLAQMQQVKSPVSGRYNPSHNRVEPFELRQEIAWPFPIESMPELSTMTPALMTYPERVKAYLRSQLQATHEYKPSATTEADIAWAEDFITAAQNALDEPFKPCLLMEDYKEGNLVVTKHDEQWQVSGVFDLMEAHFGDGEADLSRQMAEYLNEDPQLAAAFFAAYRQAITIRPGFIQRFPVYMLLDRIILWSYFQQQGWCWWPEEWTFRDWAKPYISPPIIFDQL